MGELFHLNCFDSELLTNERNRVMNLLQKLTPAGSVMEVGSTAVAGAVGKQDIDFAVRVPAPFFVKTRRCLDAYLERNPDQLSNSEYQGYHVGSNFDVAVQLIVSGGQYDHFERFLQALNSNSDLVKAYNSLKRKWNGKPMDDYRRAKRAFIEVVLAECI